MKLQAQLTQKQIQTLSQLLSPRMIMMMKHFHQPYSELLQEIKEASKENVFIEVHRYDQLMNYEEHFDAPSHNQTLYEFVSSQLDMLPLSSQEKKISLFLLDHLDDRGFLINYDYVRETVCERFSVAPRKVNEILGHIQTLEPDGIASRTLKECFVTQLSALEFENDQLKDIIYQAIHYHLNDLLEERFEKVAKALDIPISGVDAIIAYIKQNLSVNPGAQFGHSTQGFHVVPSFEVRIENGQIVVENLETTKGVQLKLSDKYLSLYHDPTTDAETKAFLEEKFQQAKQLMEDVEKRRENLDMLVRQIVQHQERFLMKGALYMEPLLQKDLAERVSVSASTVSRIVSSKYIRTPHGTFPLKYMCPRQYFGKTVERLKAIVQDIATENPGYSDEKIKHVMHAQGIPIARRTVTKYRTLKGLKTSYERGKRDANSAKSAS